MRAGRSLVAMSRKTEAVPAESARRLARARKWALPASILDRIASLHRIFFKATLADPLGGVTTLTRHSVAQSLRTGAIHMAVAPRGRAGERGRGERYVPRRNVAVTTVWMPPRTLKSPTIVTSFGSRRVTRSSRIRLVTSS